MQVDFGTHFRTVSPRRGATFRDFLMFSATGGMFPRRGAHFHDFLMFSATGGMLPRGGANFHELCYMFVKN